jgi:hypothetical protein
LSVQDFRKILQENPMSPNVLFEKQPCYCWGDCNMVK